MNILINAGPTRESIDPVRFITNHSSGKMGYAIAEAAVRIGHTVTLVSGPVAIQPPEGLAGFIRIETASQMAQAMKQAMPEAELMIKAEAHAIRNSRNRKAIFFWNWSGRKTSLCHWESSNAAIRYSWASPRKRMIWNPMRSRK